MPQNSSKEKNSMVTNIINMLLVNKENILIHSMGGTGKTEILRQVLELLNQNYPNIPVYATATTGVAAINLNMQDKKIFARTLHSWAGVGLAHDSENKLYYDIIKHPDKRKRWIETKILIIDEISMLSAKLMDLLDRLARRIRGVNYPFGNIRLLLSGDFLQLPPVKEEWAFSSDVWEQLYLHPIILVEPKRYNDIEWFERLKRVRVGKHTRQDIDFFNSKISAWGEYKASEKDKLIEVKPTIVFSKNIDVQAYNDRELEKIPDKLNYFDAIDDFELNPGSKQEKYEQILEDSIPKRIQLKVGAQVMLRINLSIPDGYVNGSRGVVSSISPIGVYVKWMNGNTTLVEKYVWKYSDKEGTAMRTQIPLICAFSTSIHKSQGATLDYIVSDLGYDIFLPGQAYVAISRVKNGQGLLLTNFNESSIMVDRTALAYSKKIEKLAINLDDPSKHKIECDMIEIF